MKLVRAGLAALVIAVAGLALSASGAWATSPPNDDFADAVLLPGSPAVVDSNTISATSEAGEPLHPGADMNRSSWFKVTPEANGPVTMSTCGPSSSIKLIAYTGSAVNSLTAVSDGNCRIFFNAIAGTEYHVAAYPANLAASGFFRVYYRLQPPPVNDDFANAEVLTGSSDSTSGDNSGGTRETGEPVHNGSNNNHTVWYKWTAPSDGTAALNICHSDMNPDLGIYTGNSVSTLTPISGSDCGDTFPATTGTTYYFAVASSNTYAPGDFYLKIKIFNKPANDEFANSVTIPAAGGSADGQNGGATVEAMEPLTGGADSTVWYSWTPSASGLGYFNVCDAAGLLDPRIIAYAGDTLGGLSQLKSGACRFSMPVTGGDTYRIQIDGSDPQDVGDFHLDVSLLPPPANDNLANATVLNGQSANASGTYSGATLEPSEVHPTGNDAGGIWFTWTAPSSNLVTFDTCGSNFDTYLAIYANGASFPLSVIAQNDDTNDGGCGLRSASTFNPIAGTTYKIGIYAFSSAWKGDYKLRISEGPLQPTKRSVSVTKEGTGTGTVISTSSSELVCGVECSQQSNDGSYVQLVALAEPGSEFVGWKGQAGCPGTVPCSVYGDSDSSVVAVFTDVLHKTLTVEKDGSGSGAVLSTPAGINCGATCAHTYDTDTVVTLNPRPSSGSAFAGWAGACTGTGACQVTMDDEKDVTATFNTIPLTLKTGKPKINKKKGTALLPVTVNVAAKITVSGKGVKKKSVTTKGAKMVKVTIVATGKLRKALKKKGKAVAKLRIVARPASGGSAVVKTKKVTLKLKKKRARQGS